MSTDAASLRAAREDTLEAMALNDRQDHLLFNADRDVNSVGERLVGLGHFGVPADYLRDIFADLRELIELNARERGCEARIAGGLETLADVVDPDGRIPQALSIKSIAFALRLPLRVLGAPEQHDARQVVRARRTLRRVLASATTEQLRSPSLRHELRAKAHDLLLEQIEAAS